MFVPRPVVFISMSRLPDGRTYGLLSAVSETLQRRDYDGAVGFDVYLNGERSNDVSTMTRFRRTP